jgi:hypothetical protein
MLRPRRFRTGSLVCAIVSIAVAQSLIAQGRPVANTPQKTAIAGLVIDDATDAPLQGVEVVLLGGQVRATTDQRGNFLLAAERGGDVVVIMRRLGYKPLAFTTTVADGQVNDMSAAMTRVVQALPEVAVTGKTDEKPNLDLADFEARKTRGFGSFFTHADIQRRQVQRVTDLIRVVPSLEVREMNGALLAISKRSGRPDGRGRIVACTMPIAVDRMLMPPGTSPNLIEASDIAGVEVYTGMAARPAGFEQLDNSAWCGLIIIWTRRGKG